MNLLSLFEIFTNSLFRIPDYQRGYSWGLKELQAFWEDLINLSDERIHYTGMLSLKDISSSIGKESEEGWLVNGQNYKIYEVVDGQQRLTTTVILIQVLIEMISENPDKMVHENITYLGTNSLNSIIEQYIIKVQMPRRLVQTYIFGYQKDDPSFDYLRQNIFGGDQRRILHETFYTKNLRKAKEFFRQAIQEEITSLKSEEYESYYHKIFKTLTQRMKFNVYVIDDDLDIFVSFETMNNRGKKLSNLELLKNRLIYLTTLYKTSELKDDERSELRKLINTCWQTIYHHLGKEARPLNDDDFLKAHWVVYFKYERNRSNAYVNRLLDQEFVSKRVHNTRSIIVSTEDEDLRDDFDIIDEAIETEDRIKKD